MAAVRVANRLQTHCSGMTGGHVPTGVHTLWPAVGPTRQSLGRAVAEPTELAPSVRSAALGEPHSAEALKALTRKLVIEYWTLFLVVI